VCHRLKMGEEVTYSHKILAFEAERPGLVPAFTVYLLCDLKLDCSFICIKYY
jgi:hypothetical protein